MGPTLDRVFVGVALSGLAAWVAWGWTSWIRTRPKSLSFGIACSVVGFTLASLSASLEIGSGLYAQFTDGFPFMDPNLLRIYRWGLLSALLGLVCGVFGADSKNPLRLKAPALSTFLLLLWVAQAIGE